MAYQKGHASPNKGKSKSYQWLVDHIGYDYDACLIWPFCRTRGYGAFQYNGKRDYAHRAMCELVNGPAPSPRHQAAHNCGRGDEGCCHPKHLAWKLPKENQNDRKVHGTVNRNWDTCAKLTPEQRQEVIGLALYSDQTFDQIASAFGISRRGVAYIVKNADKSDARYRAAQLA